MGADSRDDEFGLIAKFFAPLAAAESGALGLLDDAAVLSRDDGDLVVTTDALISGVHFLSDDPPPDIARKALRVNLSDLAAMGATARAYTLAIALPDTVSADWLSGFAGGLAADQEAFAVTLIGGDTVATPGPLMISITALGSCPGGAPVRRSGARPGDRIFVSGTIGDAALGLRIRRGELSARREDQKALIDRYRLPRPRVSVGPRLVGVATAMIDVSDGLAADLEHILSASGVGATIDSAEVPLSAGVRHLIDSEPALVQQMLTGGDDYELLFTVSEDRVADIAALSSELAVPLTTIGLIECGRELTIMGPDGISIAPGEGGYRHF